MIVDTAASQFAPDTRGLPPDTSPRVLASRAGGHGSPVMSTIAAQRSASSMSLDGRPLVVSRGPFPGAQPVGGSIEELAAERRAATDAIRGRGRGRALTSLSP
jgi:hypothetical protein